MVDLWQAYDKLRRNLWKTYEIHKILCKSGPRYYLVNVTVCRLWSTSGEWYHTTGDTATDTLTAGVVVADTNKKFVLFAVDDDCCDLLVHEDQNSCKKCREDGSEYPVPSQIQWVYQPTTLWWRWLTTHKMSHVLHVCLTISMMTYM